MKTQSRKKSNAIASLFLIIVFINFTTGCYYYKVQTQPRITADELRAFDSVQKYLILHEADTAWHLSGLVVEGQSFSGSISQLPEVHQKYKTTIVDKSNRYKRHSTTNDESDVIKEVHLYSTDVESKRDSSVTGRLLSVNRVDVYNKDKKKTTLSWVLPFVIIPVALIPVAIIIAIAANPPLQDFRMSF